MPLYKKENLYSGFFAEQLFGVELRSEADDFIRLTTYRRKSGMNFGCTTENGVNSKEKFT